MAYLGIDGLRNKLATKSLRVILRYRYYDAKMAMEYYRPQLPTHLAQLASVLGWCATAVDSVADRTVFREFGDDAFNMNWVFRQNNMDILPSAAIKAALIGACSFIYIAPDADGFPRMRVLDAADATGVVDPVTYMLKEGYAVLERDQNGIPTLEAYFLPGETQYYPVNGEAYSIRTAAPYPLLVPVIYRPDATRAFGHSRITRSCMDLTQAAMRTMMRSEIAAEFYSYPQRYMVGTSPDADDNGFDAWVATMSMFLRVDKDEDGDHPVMGQFQQSTMSPFTEQLKSIASQFAGDTGLTLDDLGIPQQNPSSSDAIKASHERLRLTVRAAQRSFGTGFINAGYLGACVRDKMSYSRQEIYETKVKWYPIFEPDVSQIGVLGDAINKIQQAFPDYFTEERVRDLTGI